MFPFNVNLCYFWIIGLQKLYRAILAKLQENLYHEIPDSLIIYCHHRLEFL